MKKDLVKNKWLRVLIIFIIGFFSFFIFDLIHSNSLVIIWAVYLLKFLFTLFIISLLCIFVFGIGKKDLFKKFGITKKNNTRSLLISIILIFLIVLFGVLIFLSNYGGLNTMYGGDFKKYITDFDPLLPSYNSFLILVFGIILTIFVSFTEEFIFRGLMINFLASKNYKKDIILAVLVSSILFSLWHFDKYFTFVSFIEFFVMGILFSLVFIFSKRNILGAGIFHTIHNLWWPAHIFRIIGSLFF